MLGFDDGNIAWRPIERLGRINYHVLNVDEKARIVDLLFKFVANQRIALRTHVAEYWTLALQGELRLFRPNGDPKEGCAVGSYVAGSAGGEPHTEGGGDCDAIVYFTNRNVDRPIHEILDEELAIVTTFSIPEFKALLEKQSQTASSQAPLPLRTGRRQPAREVAR